MVNVADLQSLNVIWVEKYFKKIFYNTSRFSESPSSSNPLKLLTAVLPFQSHAGGEEKLKLGQTGFKMTPQ